MATLQQRRGFLGSVVGVLGACGDPFGSNSGTVTSNDGDAPADGGAGDVPVSPLGPIADRVNVPGIVWPTPESIDRSVAHEAVFAPLAMPPYLSRVSEPRVAKAASAGRGRPTELTRISDASAFVAPSRGGWTNFGPAYASRQHWNADHSRMILHAFDISTNGAVNPHFLATAAHLLDGRTGAYLKPCLNAERGLPQHWRWSNTNPEELLFVEPQGTTLSTYTPARDAFGVLKDFAPTFDAVTPDFNGGNAEPDLSGRYWVLGMRRAGAWYLVCWDRRDDKRLCEIPVPIEPGTGHLTDATMSRSGEFICVSSKTAWASGSVPIARGIAIFDRAGKYLRSLDHFSSATDIIDHNGCALDSDGNDVWVYFHSATGGDDRAIRSIRLDGSSDGPGRVEVASGLILGAFYFIGCAFRTPDWIVVSDYPVAAGNSVFNQYPYRGMIWAFRLDGSGTVYPIALSRFSTSDFKGLDWYFMIPWATPNRDLSAVLFKSSMNLDWAQGGHDTFHAFLARAAP